MTHVRVAAITAVLVLFGGFGRAGPAAAKVADPPECIAGRADNPVQLAVDYSRLVVGEPDEDVGSVVDAGTVTDIQYVNGARQRAVTISQDSPGISGALRA